MIKILIISLLVLDAGIILLFVLFMRRFVRHDHSETIAIEQLEEILQPTLTEAKSISYKLEVLLKEKQQLLTALTDKLDQKISQVNAILEQPVNKQQQPLQTRQDKSLPNKGKSKNFKEFQDDVLRLSRQGLPADQIAIQLNVSKSEVDLILSLRKNIEQVRDITTEMEKNDSFETMTFNQSVTPKKSPIIKDILQKKLINPSPIQPQKISRELPPRKSGITFESRSNSDAINADEILKLSRSGLQSDAIAKKMGLAQGEVDLVLNLKNKFQTIGQNFNKLNAYK
jgi:DNA-binding CsgD family transcriptional regulator